MLLLLTINSQSSVVTYIRWVILLEQIPSTLEQWLDHVLTTQELQLIHCVYQCKHKEIYVATWFSVSL